MSYELAIVKHVHKDGVCSSCGRPAKTAVRVAKVGATKRRSVQRALLKVGEFAHPLADSKCPIHYRLCERCVTQMFEALK